MHAFSRLFTTDLVANDCRGFDCFGALTKNDEKHLCRPLWTIEPQHTEFTNFMNKHCSEWSSNDRIYQSPMRSIYTSLRSILRSFLNVSLS